MERVLPLVAIRCTTYNHEPYIKDTLEGFVKQKTTFPFVAIVHDDASTDGTVAIIKEYAEKYPDIIKPIYESENQYSKQDGSLTRIMNEACKATGAKYVAICEGDDYWTDPLKLQKQIDIMESDPDITLSFHSVYEIFETATYNNTIRKKISNRYYTGVEWFRTRPSQTASFIHKIDILDSKLYNAIINSHKFLVGDVPLVLVCACSGKIFGLSDTMSIYRHNPGGWSAVKRNKEDRWKIIKMQLNYEIFGREYIKPAKYFAQKECVAGFLVGLKQRKIESDFIKFSLKLSFFGTLRAFYKILCHKYD